MNEQFNKLCASYYDNIFPAGERVFTIGILSFILQLESVHQTRCSVQNMY